MSWMFREAKTFNQDIGNWNVGNVNAMTGMLRDAKLFNRRSTAIKPAGFHVCSAGFLASVTFTSL
jgi:surface protein